MWTGFRLTAITLLVVLIAGTGCGDESIFWPRREFNAKEWNRTDEYHRYIFAKDLLDGKLIGLTREEIKTKLGRPSSEYPEGMNYIVKEVTEGLNAVEFIYIRFDMKGKASEAGLGED